ncbi:HSF-type DNA-binding-domain-containing protein [Leucosporidium creatinivorum]|uniref:HSF-type DNA-binding-domain-containing protein n=1 Tax=Leucosporidium creatinivorum TaxID=106004 RepID=A0A1Y2FBE0_9BASI|nr:HSF-type DNA-binding-domain-containing protein [Leucosporidium creatinivorum]
MATTHPHDQHQYSYDDPLVSPYSSSFSLSPNDLVGSWDGFNGSPQLAVHLEHPDYSQHHAGLVDSVDSARWTADYSPASGNAYLPFAPPLVGVGASSVAGAVDLALQENPSATVGDFLSHLPVHDIHASPTTSQRRLSVDEQVNANGEFDVSKIAAFPARLLDLLDDESYNDCLCWDSSGYGLIVCNASPRLLQEVLPANFKHSNINSFTRQLNVYGFKRMSQAELADRLDTSNTGNYSGWAHPAFLRDDRSSTGPHPHS